MKTTTEQIEKVREELSASTPWTFADFLLLAKKVAPFLEEMLPAGERKMKTAFLSSFTTQGLREVLTVKCLQAGISADFYTGGYQQYAQEILNPQSGFYAFDPDVTILFVDLQSLAGDFYFRPYKFGEEDRRAWIDGALERLLALIHPIEERTHSRVLIHDFEVPLYSPLGILESKQNFGFHDAVRTLNQKLREAAKNDPRLFIFDYDGFCSTVGKQNIQDLKMVYLGDMKLDVRHLPALCGHYLAYFKAFSGCSRKCLVLDLDNTLWGGVLGEDGFEGIRLGPTPEGRPFWEFQQHLLGLFDRGVILAVNSRNNPEEALKVIREHPSMVLGEKHFASIQINWNDKAANLKTIARELNIGTNALAFIDDDKVNCDMVRQVMPEVRVVELPEDPSLYCKTLFELQDFNTLQFTEEDRIRGGVYASQRLRENLKKEISVEDYLKSLETVMTVETAHSFTLPRIAQLTQKTNQFNMTTRRYSEADLRKFAESKSFGVWSFRLEDKFSDLGIIAAVIAEKRLPEWRIDTFLMSCRVLARGVEQAILAFLVETARREGASFLTGEFIPTEKNPPAMNFYREQGFQKAPDDGKAQIWKLPVSHEVLFPEGISIKVNASL